MGKSSRPWLRIVPRLVCSLLKFLSSALKTSYSRWFVFNKMSFRDFLVGGIRQTGKSVLDRKFPSWGDPPDFPDFREFREFLPRSPISRNFGKSGLGCRKTGNSGNSQISQFPVGNGKFPTFPGIPGNRGNLAFPGPPPRKPSFL
jgi:hypothetical protein